MTETVDLGAPVAVNSLTWAPDGGRRYAVTADPFVGVTPVLHVSSPAG